MSFPYCLQRSESNAEITIQTELQNRGLMTLNKITRDDVILFYEDHYIVTDKSKVTNDMMIDVIQYSLPDFSFLPVNFFYIDGPIHLKLHSSKRDARIDRFARLYNLKVHRYPYTSPLRISMLTFICNSIERVVYGKEKKVV